MPRTAKQSPNDGAPVGYLALQQRYTLQTVPNWHESAIRKKRSVHREQGRVFEEFPASYAPGDTLGDQLEFALKYDGLNLEILAALFGQVEKSEITEYVKSRPTGKFARTVWYLYEWLTDATLPIDDLEQGNYFSLLANDKYYTAAGRRIRRQRVLDNMLGNKKFCPLVRRTENLVQFEQKDYASQCAGVVSQYPSHVLKRTLSYLYTKETKSSFAIEHAAPDTGRTERFIALLKNAEHEDYFNKPALVELQNRIVDERYRESDFREDQNYIGENVAWRENIHFVPPRPEDVAGMMEGLNALHHRLEKSGVNPVVHAAAIAFGFVYVHPFGDGNGRIHRFLVHNILSRRGFTPEGFIFPISAAMLRDMKTYDTALETLSQPLLPLLNYDLNGGGEMTVHAETAVHYRYADLTLQTEALFHFIERTIEIELPEELAFLQSYDVAKRGIQSVVDLPDRLIDLLIRFCLQNNGSLSARKRERYFGKLKDAEVHGMEKVVREAYNVELR